MCIYLFVCLIHYSGFSANKACGTVYGDMHLKDQSLE